jgi:flagellar hook protein FlgE
MGYRPTARHDPPARRGRCRCPPPASRRSDRPHQARDEPRRAPAVTLPATRPLIDFDDPTTYNNATSLTVYDAKGQDVALTYYFQKAATDTWNVYVTANGTPLRSTPRRPGAVDADQFPPTAARRPRRSAR